MDKLQAGHVAFFTVQSQGKVLSKVSEKGAADKQGRLRDCAGEALCLSTLPGEAEAVKPDKERDKEKNSRPEQIHEDERAETEKWAGGHRACLWGPQLRSRSADCRTHHRRRH